MNPSNSMQRTALCTAADAARSQMKAIGALSIILLASGCVAPRHPPAGVAEPIAVEGVDVADGVGRDEAYRIALRYFNEFHGSCGGMDLSKETSTAWRFQAVAGFDAIPKPDIVVQKDGSLVSQRGSPDAVYKDGVWRYRGRNFFNYESKG